MNSPEGDLNYTYYPATGRLASTCTTNSYIAYDYDELGRLKTVTASKRNGVSITPETTTYTYTPVGNRSTITNANGVVTIYLYDNLNRLTNLTHSIGGNLLASYSYQLHPTGCRTNAVEWLKQEDGAWLTNTLTWSYDQMYRLTNEVSVSSASGGAGTYTHSYQYDQVGNRVKKIRYTTVIETNVAYFNNNDQLTREEITPSSGTLSTNYYAYDDNGSVIARTNAPASGSATIALYDYDLKNKLSSVANYNGSWTTNRYEYNDQGILVRSIAGASTTYYLIDANNHTGYQQILEESTGRGVTASRSYVIGDDVLAQAGSTASYLLYDGHDSTRQLADGSGGVSQRYNYDAYGITQTGTSSSSPSTSLLYCGEQFDSALEMYNLRARFYQPDSGRFCTMDTYEGTFDEPLSLHRYIYCNSSPVDSHDPTGHAGELVEQLNVAGIAAVIIGLYLVAVVEQKTHATQTLAAAAWNEAVADGATVIAAAEAALAMFRTSVRELIAQAKEILKQLGRLIGQLKVVPIPRSVIPNVAANVATAQATGKPIVLTRTTPVRAVINRALATAGLPPAGLKMSWDEYPFASSVQGGRGARVVAVPALENSIQGGIIAACYFLERINVGTPYVVLVTP